MPDDSHRSSSIAENTQRTQCQELDLLFGKRENRDEGFLNCSLIQMERAMGRFAGFMEARHRLARSLHEQDAATNLDSIKKGCSFTGGGGDVAAIWIGSSGSGLDGDGGSGAAQANSERGRAALDFCGSSRSEQEEDFRLKQNERKNNGGYILLLAPATGKKKESKSFPLVLFFHFFCLTPPNLINERGDLTQVKEEPRKRVA
ncbi:hypothetical protein KSP39_PZI006046 [Platanthera zijinensis]|uniref:Uncharacterized protein n=1 Tax=Platanthera zijinensis TaxID=2320716 RepID=A0AAP0BU59_9ASPA